MDPVDEARLDAGQGLSGDANYGSRRQITVIEKEIFEAVSQVLGRHVNPSARRANLMVSALPLAESRGRLLQVGSCRIRIQGETKPCETMDKACEGLREVLIPNWGGGAYGEMIEGGEIAVGDSASWSDHGVSEPEGD
jgi:MOSC domain-containing protein YiiM